MTIHITPEPSCSYVSFESNVPVSCYEEVITRVLQAFRPNKFVLTVFATPVSTGPHLWCRTPIGNMRKIFFLDYLFFKGIFSNYLNPQNYYFQVCLYFFLCINICIFPIIVLFITFFFFNYTGFEYDVSVLVSVASKSVYAN